jgi:hypothetical protein
MVSFAESVESRVPSVSSQIYGAPSVVYVLILLLAFVNPRQPEDELVVVSVTLRANPVPQWTIDATGQFGTFIAEETRLTASDKVAMAADAGAAAATVAAFLKRSDLLLVEVLLRELA